MAYAGLGVVRFKSPVRTTPLTAEQIAARRLESSAFNVCNDLSKAGLLPILPPHPNAGMRAVLGTKEMTECTARALEKLRAGGTPQEASDTVMAASASGGKKWLIYGGIAAVALVGGAYLFTRK